MPSPKTLSKSDTRTVLLKNIKTSVIEFHNAESSALWNIVKACHKAVQSLDTGTVRRTLDEAFQVALPNYGEASATTTMSMICKIAFHATEQDFERWAESRLGFRKAYQEFAKPQKHPAKAKASETHIMTDEELAEADAALARGETDPDDEVETTNATGKPKSAAQLTKEAASKAKAAKAATPLPEAGDPTAAWATRIDRDRRLWTKLLANLMPTDSNAKMLTFDMVYEAIDIFIGGNERKTDEFVSTLLQKHELLGKRAKAFIEDNP